MLVVTRSDKGCDAPTQSGKMIVDDEHKIQDRQFKKMMLKQVMEFELIFMMI